MVKKFVEGRVLVHRLPESWLATLPIWIYNTLVEVAANILVIGGMNDAIWKLFGEEFGLLP